MNTLIKKRLISNSLSFEPGSGWKLFRKQIRKQLYEISVKWVQPLAKRYFESRRWMADIQFPGETLPEDMCFLLACVAPFVAASIDGSV